MTAARTVPQPRVLMRVLYLCASFPFPPRSGADHRNLSVPRELSERVDQRILCRSRRPVDNAVLASFRRLQLQADIVVEPRPGPARKIIKALGAVARGWPIRMGGYHFNSVKRRLARRLTDDKPDLVVVEGPWLAAYWPIIQAAGVVVVLDLHNLEEERLRRDARLQRGIPRLVSQIDAGRMKRIEENLIRSVDSVFVTSERELAVVKARHPRARIKTIPNGVDCETIRRLPFRESREILFVGALDYYPNVDAVTYFVHAVLPLVREKVPEATLRIIGRSPTAAVLNLNMKEGVTVTGEVGDLEEYYLNCGVCVVPLRTGGGTRLKILEAMAYGRPVVATALGAEGIDVEDQTHLLIADSHDQMSDAISRLLVKRDFTCRLVNRARMLCEHRYSWGGIADRVYEEFSDLISRHPGG